jgi:hypothetical protein
MTPQTQAAPAGDGESEAAHAYIDRVTREYHRMRGKILKGETMYEDSVEKAGKLAELTIDALAHNLRKREPHLSKEQAFSKIYSDPQYAHLAKAERCASRMAAGIEPQRSAPEISEAGQIDFTKGEREQWAFNELQRQAMELNKSHPELTHEQCFSRVYCAPESVELRKSERETNRPGGYAEPYEKSAAAPVASLDPVVEHDMAMGELKRLTAHIRAQNPFHTNEQLFAMVMSDPANRDAVRRERAASRALLGV